MFINDKSDSLKGSVNVSRVIVDADGTRKTEETVIVKEHFLDLIVNERLVAKLVCTPTNLVELGIGRLVTEGIIDAIEETESIYVCTSGNSIKVFLKEDKELELDTSIKNEPTCCTGNKAVASGIGDGKLSYLTWKVPSSKEVFDLANVFAKGSKIHKATNGTHSCILSYKGEIAFISEDIGRHNALDKAIGYAVINGYDRSECILFTTGRVPTDMAEKVIAAKIPVLVSKAVPTSEAIAMATQYNLTLICKAWPDRYEIFNQPEQEL